MSSGHQIIHFSDSDGVEKPTQIFYIVQPEEAKHILVKMHLINLLFSYMSMSNVFEPMIWRLYEAIYKKDYKIAQI